MSKLLEVEHAAHSGAFGFNELPTPTAYQIKTGQYPKGRVDLHGLPIAIESPRYSIRCGTSASGISWQSRMAAHYGYIDGTKGRDGDEIDVFIGPFVESESVFIVNQVFNGRFDEHKIMIGFPDEDSARLAYLFSYEPGWQGLGGILELNLHQLRWWLLHGDKNAPATSKNIPPKGLEFMRDTVIWDDAGEPVSTTLAKVLYDIRLSDSQDGLLFDAVSMGELMEDFDSMILDALVTTLGALQPKVNALMAVMSRTGGSLKVAASQVSDPFTKNGTANVAALFELSDGQTVSVYLHNPDTTPKKIGADDKLVSWKWLLNKKDITIVVAPESGKDLNVREVARRIMKLAEKNSAAFARANGRRAERLANIESLKTEVSSLEAELKAAEKDLELAKIEAEEAASKPAEATTANSNSSSDISLEPEDVQHMLESEPITITGNELGEYDTTAEGKKEFQAAVKKYLKSLRGKWIDVPSLGPGVKVEIRNRSIKEMGAFLGNPTKLKLMSAIERIVGTAHTPEPSENIKKAQKRNVKGYFYLQNKVVVAGEVVGVRVVIEEDEKGLLHYDVIIDQQEAKTAHLFDSAVWDERLTLDNNSRNGPFDYCSTKVFGSQVLDSASGNVSTMVVNLFIDGEAIEEVVPDDSTNPDRDYLQSIIDGTLPDLASEAVGSKLEEIYPRIESNPDLMAMLEQAANVYSAAVIAAAKRVMG
jgi:hypothetical protein